MKKLLFAPLFLDEGLRLERNKKWIDYIFSIKQHLKFDEILFIDNASGENKLKEFENHISKFKPFPITIIKCKTRLLRKTAHAYGFWYSAFGKAAKYGIDNNFDIIIHCDSDVFPLNTKICNYINNFKSGWLAFWCFMYNYPETTFQLISKDKFEEMYEFMTRDFLRFYPDGLAELEIPFTHIEKGFNGDRFGEKQLQQQPDMDWFGQCPVETVIKFNEV